jgi:hypothetical protein
VLGANQLSVEEHTALVSAQWPLLIAAHGNMGFCVLAVDWLVTLRIPRKLEPPPQPQHFVHLLAFHARQSVTDTDSGKMLEDLNYGQQQPCSSQSQLSHSQLAPPNRYLRMFCVDPFHSPSHPWPAGRVLGANQLLVEEHTALVSAQWSLLIAARGNMGFCVLAVDCLVALRTLRTLETPQKPQNFVHHFACMEDVTDTNSGQMLEDLNC